VRLLPDLAIVIVKTVLILMVALVQQIY